MTRPLRLVEVDQLDCRLVAHRWRFEESHAEEIDAHWTRTRRENPKLYDGLVLLACRAAEEEREGVALLRMELFETRFSRFLAWRDFGWVDETVFNCFAMPAVRSSDGAFLLGEMGAGHSSAGQIYFPGGTPDPSDVVADGRVDLDGSLSRELAEETGLDAAEGRARPGWTIIFDGQRIACLKRIDWDLPAATLRARVQDFLSREETPELSDVHMFTRADPLDDPRLPSFMRGFLTHVFTQSREGLNFPAAQGRLAP